MTETLPTFPPSGHTRYKSVAIRPGQNPFSPRGIMESTNTIDLPSDTPRERVEKWAREAAEIAGLRFLRLETLTF